MKSSQRTNSPAAASAAARRRGDDSSHLLHPTTTTTAALTTIPPATATPEKSSKKVKKKKKRLLLSGIVVLMFGISFWNVVISLRTHYHHPSSSQRQKNGLGNSEMNPMMTGQGMGHVSAQLTWFLNSSFSSSTGTSTTKTRTSSTTSNETQTGGDNDALNLQQQQIFAASRASTAVKIVQIHPGTDDWIRTLRSVRHYTYEYQVPPPRATTNLSSSTKNSTTIISNSNNTFSFTPFTTNATSATSTNKSTRTIWNGGMIDYCRLSSSIFMTNNTEDEEEQQQHMNQKASEEEGKLLRDAELKHRYMQQQNDERYFVTHPVPPLLSFSDGVYEHEQQEQQEQEQHQQQVRPLDDTVGFSQQQQQLLILPPLRTLVNTYYEHLIDRYDQAQSPGPQLIQRQQRQDNKNSNETASAKDTAVQQQVAKTNSNAKVNADNREGGEENDGENDAIDVDSEDEIEDLNDSGDDEGMDGESLSSIKSELEVKEEAIEKLIGRRLSAMQDNGAGSVDSIDNTTAVRHYYPDTSSCRFHLDGVAADSDDEFSTTLVVQTSISRIWLLAEHCKRWRNHPIVAVVACDDSIFATATERCTNNPKLEEFVRKLLHKRNRKQEKLEGKKQKQLCPNPSNIKLIALNKEGSTYHYAHDAHNMGENAAAFYPINVLRNIGLDAATTGHIISVDIDFLPSQDLDLHIEKVLSMHKSQESLTGNKNYGIVVPAFQLVHNGKHTCTSAKKCKKIAQNNVPKNFTQLQECYYAHPEHLSTAKRFLGMITKAAPNHTSCRSFGSSGSSGHSTTNPSAWIEKKWYEHDFEVKIEGRNQLSGLAYTKNITTHIDNHEAEKRLRRIPCLNSFRYEPFLVLPWCPSSISLEEYTQLRTSDSFTRRPLAPYYDERFHGYGKNKISYTHLLHAIGYDLFVLPEGFIIHTPHSSSPSKRIWKKGRDTAAREEDEEEDEEKDEIEGEEFGEVNEDPTAQKLRHAKASMDAVYDQYKSELIPIIGRNHSLPLCDIQTEDSISANYVFMILLIQLLVVGLYLLWRNGR